jgi:diguanylate cyclase (GGDEF)-like protein
LIFTPLDLTPTTLATVTQFQHMSRQDRAMEPCSGTQRTGSLLGYWRQLWRQACESFDWRRPEIRDGSVILVAIGLIYALSEWYALPPIMFQFALDHADWGVDDFIFVFFFMSAGFAVYSYRRVKDLFHETTARRAAEIEARNLAGHDPLTGLPNRRFFVEKLAEVLSRTTATSRSAVLLLDLDGFKSINNAYGHTAGDQVLAGLSERLSAVMGPGVFLTRIGGDEFAVIMPAIISRDDPAALARTIAATVAEPLLIDHASIVLGVGIGIAIASTDGMDPTVLVRHADLALYHAKAEGRSCIRLFEPDMDALIEHRTEIERELRSAIADRLIVPHYQPKVALKDSRVTGFEALARWHSETFGWVAPDVFIAVAEEIGLLNELADQVLRQACLDAKTWPAEMTLAFNISASQLRDHTLGRRVLAILAETGVSPHRLELEITETALADNIAVVQRILDEMRQAGIRIALDDFGCGYATLRQLLDLRLDRVKIDRGFVAGFEKDEDSTAIVRAILGLAIAFGLATTAEGIEDADQLAALRANGCLEGQGYLFGRAVPAQEIPSILEKLRNPSCG